MYFRHQSHQIQLFSPTNSTNEIHKASCKLFDEFWDGTPIRNLGIHTGKIVQDGDDKQLNLFDMNCYEKLSRLDLAVDSIREDMERILLYGQSFWMGQSIICLVEFHQRSVAKL